MVSCGACDAWVYDTAKNTNTEEEETEKETEEEEVEEETEEEEVEEETEEEEAEEETEEEEAEEETEEEEKEEDTGTWTEYKGLDLGGKGDLGKIENWKSKISW